MSKEVSEKIEQVLTEVCLENEDAEKGDILVEWLVIGFIDNPETDDSAYPMFFSNSTMPMHRARGLLHTGLKMLEED